MSRATSRRGFLRHTAVAATAGLTAVVRPADAPAIEPIARNGSPRFKFSLAAYSYRDLLSGESPPLAMEDFIADCAEMGLEGTELTSYYFPPEPAPEYLRRLKQQTFRLGLDISGTAVGNDFCHPPGPDRDRELAHVKLWVDRAELLGAPVIRIFSGGQREGQSQADAHRLVVEGIEVCCAYAGEHGVFLALENHGGLTATAEGILALVRDVQSPWFGVNLDTGNFHGSDPYAELAMVAPYALNVQVKVVVTPADGQRQPADFGRLAALLRDAGYRGYVVLEYEEQEDPRQACPRYIDKLREAFS